MYLTAGTPCFADAGFPHEEPLRLQIQQWVQQLGNDSYLVRQRAESLLTRAGIQAYPELRRARQSPDVEIVRRAEYILSQIEQAFLDMENQETAYWIHLYMLDSNPAGKARIIWFLADPLLDFTTGEGLQTLCRLVRFEENSTLRLEVAKSLIASPPIAPMARQRWFQYIRDNIHSTGDDELFQIIANYAKLWCDVMLGCDSEEAAENARSTITPEFQERVRQVSAATLRLLERPENRIQIGSKIDILLHYAIAELQDAAGLIEERDETIALALAIEPGPIQTTEPIMQIGVDDDLLMNEHYHTGRYLKQRFRLPWAIAHFQRVMETGDVALRILASRYAAESAILFADYASAITFFDKQIEILRGSDHERGDAESVIAQAQRRQAYCWAAKAAATDNWEGVRESITRAWAADSSGSRDLWSDGGDIDLLIMAHRLRKQMPDIDSEFRNMMDLQLRKTWNSIVADYEHALPDERRMRMLIAFNIAAWLLANMEGDHQTALTLVEAALKVEPDDIAILDTLAHVHFLGGNIDEAIRVQEQVVRLAPGVAVFDRALERFKQGRTDGE